MSNIKNKIRIERLRQEIGNIFHIKQEKDDYEPLSFGDMSDEDIAKKYYYPAFVKHWNKYLFFRQNKDNITRVFSEVIKYDKNQPNPFEHYELQLYRAYLIFLLLFIGYEIQFSSFLTVYPIHELEEMYDFLKSEKKRLAKKNTCW